MSFWRAYYHLVWATHDRQPLINDQVERLLFPYLHKKAAEFRVIIYAINAVPDHIHLVVAIPPRYSVAEVVKSLKGAGSHYLNQSGLPFEFHWQRGYGVFTLGERQRAAAEAYVNNQKDHHRSGTTNIWLERADEIDEGPEPVAGPGLREPSPAYLTTDPESPPF
jgi:putative transposase